MTGGEMGTEPASGRSFQSIGVARQILATTIFLLLAGGMIYYYDVVLLRIRTGVMQEGNAAAGTWSDLYPRWCGAQQLLWHHGNPYSPEVTTEIERGFYGRPLNHSDAQSNPDRKRDPEEFAYPVYIVFLLAPFLGFPFHAVSLAFAVLLLLVTPATLWLWMRALNMRLPPWAFAVALVALMSSYPVLDGIHLQQLTLPVAAMLASGIVALGRGRLAVSGVLLALTMIKPQLSIPTAALLLMWTLGDWRSRKWFAVAFGSVMAALLIASEVVLPGWFGLWRQAANAYVTHHKESFLVAAFHLRTAMVIAAAATVALLAVFWRVRKELPGSAPFNFALVAALSLTVLLLPNAGSSYYNEVLLLPVVLWMFTSGWRVARESRLASIMWVLAVILLAGQWIAAFPVSVAVLTLHWKFERETTLFIAGPEFLMFYFPIFLGLFVLSAAAQAWRTE
jgi:hypothetical protein